jgi:hypothetical protein
VTERPEQLAPGAEWLVIMHPRPLPRWPSRSTVRQLDRTRLRFEYETRTDDGNPSFARWTWQVVPDGDESEIRVRWDGNPKTAARKLIFARIRRRMLQDEVQVSLRALAGRLGQPAADEHSSGRRAG